MCVNGECLAPDKCYCQSGYTGLLCDIPICNCGNHSICTAPGVCTCTGGWTGLIFFVINS